MTTRGGGRVAGVDGIRALAVIWVVLGHTWWEMGGTAPLDAADLRSAFSSSYFGVNVLFVVSGFVLYLPVARTGQLGGIAKYARRRWARIVPALYLALVVSAVVGSAVGRATPDELRPRAMLAHLTLTHQFFAPDVGYGVNGALWTLTVEAMFYALLPLVAMRFLRRPMWWLAGALAASELWQSAVVAGTFGDSAFAKVAHGAWFPSYLGHFALGMAGAVVLARIERSGPRRVVHWTYGVVGLLGGAGVVTYAWHRGEVGWSGRAELWDHTVQTTWLAFCIMLLVLGVAASGGVLTRSLDCRPMRWLGDHSYGVYLYHMPIIAILLRTTSLRGGGNNEFLVLSAIVVSASLVAGWLSARFVEIPVRALARRARVVVPVAEPATRPAVVPVPAVVLEPAAAA